MRRAAGRWTVQQRAVLQQATCHRTACRRAKWQWALFPQVIGPAGRRAVVPQASCGRPRPSRLAATIAKNEPRPPCTHGSRHLRRQSRRQRRPRRRLGSWPGPTRPFPPARPARVPARPRAVRGRRLRLRLRDAGRPQRVAGGPPPPLARAQVRLLRADDAPRPRDAQPRDGGARPEARAAHQPERDERAGAAQARAAVDGEARLGVAEVEEAADLRAGPGRVRPPVGDRTRVSARRRPEALAG